jgi:hypothetical protein
MLLLNPDRLSPQYLDFEYLQGIRSQDVISSMVPITQQNGSRWCISVTASFPHQYSSFVMMAWIRLHRISRPVMSHSAQQTRRIIQSWTPGRILASSIVL